MLCRQVRLGPDPLTRRSALGAPDGDDARKAPPHSDLVHALIDTRFGALLVFNEDDPPEAHELAAQWGEEMRRLRSGDVDGYRGILSGEGLDIPRGR